MSKTFPFLILMFVFVFSAGFIIGFFLDRSSIVYTEGEMDILRDDIESMQLQEMFASAEAADCNLIYSAMGKNSYDLYNLVDRLRTTPPESREFAEMKKDADFLSLKAWMIAKKVERTCSADILPILFVYSGNCQGCEAQDAVLKSIKEKYEQVYVYAIDFDLGEQSTELVKAAYSIGSAPAMIIGSELYGRLSEDELEEIACDAINC